MSVPAVMAGTGALASATPIAAASASTESTMAADILGRLNRDRLAAGLLPLRPWSPMASLAGQRATVMATTSNLSHTASGADPGTALTSARLQWYSFGEIIGMSTYPWGAQAAENLYEMWKASPPHHQIMFSGAYNYIGIGIAQAADGSTWSSILFTESADHTPPVAADGALTRSGTSITFAWSGGDPQLQTHTAGLRGFNVQYRVNGGAWHQIRTATTSTALHMSNRQHGSTYSFRVQAVDRRGNLSTWTAETRVRVP